MKVLTQSRPVTVALIGNPNTGKSTLFNALCGMRQRVANYPGVTVEKKIGRSQFGGHQFRIIDLPGSYSLSPRSPDEMIAIDVLLGRRDDVERPDVVVCIVDASNFERNLYLLSQVLELGIPTVLAVNMIDVAQKKGMRIDVGQLRSGLPIPVVAIQANRRLGVGDLQAAIVEALERPLSAAPNPLPAPLRREVAALEAKYCGNGHAKLPRYLFQRLLLDTSGYLTSARLPGVTSGLLNDVMAARERLVHEGLSIPGVEAIARYQWAAELARHAVHRDSPRDTQWSDRVDRVLTHRVWGTLLFVLVMMFMFQSVFYVAEPASALIGHLNRVAGDMVVSRMSDGALRSLVINGVIEGVGGVLVFLPQILVLFVFIAVLEDCGYMARAAYLMDRLMSQIGLSGKSFIPLLSSFACAVPGIMSARVVENPKDRLITILVAPLMSCSARLPVYTLLIGAFIPDSRVLGAALGLQGIVMFAMYLLGVISAVLVALVLRRTVARGMSTPFIMELPCYKLPGLRVVLARVHHSGWDFVKRAGTLILAVTILVWAVAYYPRDPARLDSALVARKRDVQEQIARLQGAVGEPAARQLAQLEGQMAAAENAIEGAYLRESLLGRAGRFIEPVVRPLGWDWRVGCAVIASFPAREVVIATLGVIYNLGDDEGNRSDSLGDTLRAATWDGGRQPVFNVPVALSIMVFFALCAQCVSTLVVMRRETNSWRWPLVTFLYMTFLAYCGALVTYQVGMRLFG